MAVNVTTRLDIDQALREDLNRYLCDTVWNLPLTELRRNIVLRAMNKGNAVKHVCDLGRTYVSTPNIKYKNNQTHEYYVYAAACCCMGGIVVDCGQSDVLNLPHYGEWVRLDNYLNIRPFDLRIHTIFGEWMHRDFCFIRNHPTEDMFLIAVDARMAEYVTSDDYNYSTMYMSVYYDSDNSGVGENLKTSSPIIDCYHIETSADINTVYDKYVEMDHDKSFMFINGRLSTPASLLDINKEDYVEFVYDPDIICNIVLDLTEDRDSHVYRSTIDGTYKYIIHIPKNKNPENYILTHNTCDIFLMPLNTANVNNANLKGLFVHRFDTSHKEYRYIKTKDKKFVLGRTYYLKSGDAYKRVNLTEPAYGTDIPSNIDYYVQSTSYMTDSAITQITHNDFGVSDKLIQSYMNTLGSSECSIRVVVRRHSKTNKLDRDCNFIRFLYELDDETILNFLNGKLSTYCSFWTAEYLEQSEWAKMLFDVPRNVTPENTASYINALGYYNAACVITPRVTTGIYSRLNTHALDFTIPRSMQTCGALDALFTIDGKLQRTSTYSVQKEYQYLHFDISDGVEIRNNALLRAEIFENKPARAEYFIPSADNFKFEIPESNASIDFDLYAVKRGLTPKSDYYTDNYISGEHIGYRKIDNKEDFVDVEYETRTETYLSSCVTESGCENPSHQLGETVEIRSKCTIKFRPDAYGYEFLIVSKEMYGRFTESDMELCGGNTIISGVQTNANGTCSELLHIGKLMIPCQHWRDSDQINIPILSPTWNVIPFCNGRELAEGIDYNVVNVYDNLGYMLFRAVVFSVNAIGRTEAMNDEDFYDFDSYLKYSNNTFDMIVTDDTVVSRFYGFLSSDEMYRPGDPFRSINNISITEIDPYVFWFNEFSKITADGFTVHTAYRKNGQLKFKGPYRNGALYNVRAVLPTETINFIEQYKDNSDDLSKLLSIVKYMRRINPTETNQLSVIPHSHHITSVVANCLVKDVMTDVVHLSNTSIESDLVHILDRYKSMKKYDPAFNGVMHDITVENSGSVIVDGSYYLVDGDAKGHDRVWKNRSNSGLTSLRYNDASSRWEFVYTSRYSSTVYYYANVYGEHEPWNLIWVRENGALPVPKITINGFDSRFVDVFPSYTSDLHEVNTDVMLRRCVDYLLSKDSVTDGATTI